MIDREDVISALRYYCENPTIAQFQYYGENIVMMPETLVRYALALIRGEDSG